jgi:hypothetical protein
VFFFSPPPLLGKLDGRLHSGSRPKFTEKHSMPPGAGSRIKAPCPRRSSLYCLDSSSTRGRTLDRDISSFVCSLSPSSPSLSPTQLSSTNST